MFTNGRISPSGSALIIESDDDLRGVLAELLELVGISCWSTPSGCEGVHLFAAHQDVVKLVIMDMGLRDKDGAVIVQELEAINPSVKIFIVSGQDKKKLELLFATHPNVSVIQKPFDTFEFLHMVNARLAQTT